MTNQHPITPPPELIEEWASMLAFNPERQWSYEKTFTEAAQWGADQELEACCAEVLYFEGKALAKQIRDTRRPQPPSLKEQALDELTSAERLYPADWSTIRRALEALPE